MTTPPPPIHNALLTIPRTASNLLVRILNLENQPSILRHPSDGYLFLSTMRFKGENDMHSRFYSAWTPSERSGMNDVFASCVADWMRLVEDAEAQRKGTCVKEHVNWMVRPDVEDAVVEEGYVGNPICIPDAFLRDKLRLTLLIRHPALVVPSLLRSALDNEGLEVVMEEGAEERMRREVSYRWHVALYEMLANERYSSREEDVKYPIVLDAADLGNEVLMKKYAGAIGLNPRFFRFVWDAESAEGKNKVDARMRDTLLASKGIVVEKLSGNEDFDLERLDDEWRQEFGEVLGNIVGRLVRGSIPEYKWLWERRLRF